MFAYDSAFKTCERGFLVLAKFMYVVSGFCFIWQGSWICQFFCSGVGTVVCSRFWAVFLSLFALLFEQSKLCLCFRVLWCWPSLKTPSLLGVWIWWFVIFTVNEASYNHREVNSKTVPDPSAVIRERINPVSNKELNMLDKVCWSVLLT